MHKTDIAFYLATSGHSGVEKVMKNLLIEFVALGLKVDILKIHNHGPKWGELPAGVRIIDLQARHVLSSFPNLLKYLYKQKPRAILSDKDKLNRNAIIAGFLSCSGSRVGVRIGTTVSENLKKRSFFSRISQYLSIYFLYRWAYCILTPSQGGAEDLAKLAGISASRVTIAPSPIINQQFYLQCRESVNHPWFAESSPPVIIAIGELSERKDFVTLIKAYAELRQKHNCRLLIVGEGKQRNKLEQLITELQIKQDVELLGYVDNPYPYLLNSSVFAMTSRCEGMPVALIEALACGVSAVSTDCPSGPRELLQAGKYGVLAAVGDSHQLALGLAKSLKNPYASDYLKNSVDNYQAKNSARVYLTALGFSLNE